jgi:hypothetical protein
MTSVSTFHDHNGYAGHGGCSPQVLSCQRGMDTLENIRPCALSPFYCRMRFQPDADLAIATSSIALLKRYAAGLKMGCPGGASSQTEA